MVFALAIGLGLKKEAVADLANVIIVAMCDGQNIDFLRFGPPDVLSNGVAKGDALVVLVVGILGVRVVEKGYVLLAEEFAKFLASLDALLVRGMHVVFLAHSTVRKFESPDQAGSYDRYELKLSKQVAPLVREWADAILFVNFITRLAEKDNGKMRGVGGKERVLFATHTAAYDAKNRHGLSDKLPFEAAALAPVFGAAVPASDGVPRAEQMEIKPVAASSGEGVESLVPEDQREETLAFLIARGQLKQGQGFAELDPAYARRVLAEPTRFLEAVRAWADDQIPGLPVQPAEEAAVAR